MEKTPSQAALPRRLLLIPYYVTPPRSCDPLTSPPFAHPVNRTKKQKPESHHVGSSSADRRRHARLWLLLLLLLFWRRRWCVQIAIKGSNDGSRSREAALPTHHRLCLPGAEAAPPCNCRVCGRSACNLLTWFAENRTGRCLRGRNLCTIRASCPPVDDKGPLRAAASLCFLSLNS